MNVPTTSAERDKYHASPSPKEHLSNDSCHRLLSLARGRQTIRNRGLHRPDRGGRARRRAGGRTTLPAESRRGRRHGGMAGCTDSDRRRADACAHSGEPVARAPRSRCVSGTRLMNGSCTGSPIDDPRVSQTHSPSGPTSVERTDATRSRALHRLGGMDLGVASAWQLHPRATCSSPFRRLSLNRQRHPMWSRSPTCDGISSFNVPSTC